MMDCVRFWECKVSGWDLFYVGGPSSMPAIEACSLKPVLKNGAFKLASIPLDLEFFTCLL